ncbi:MAG: hypothetical protein OSJ76_07615 [Alphaproteobacteria bacterium]|nr:hypothetical protein [Alphaproteobacteria bacterium]
MLKKLKQQFRILPMVIFMAVLMLSVKLNNIFDQLKDPYAKRISISQSLAAAEEKNNQETSELTRILETGDSANSDSPAAAKPQNTGFTQSEIMILQELAERREALDIRSREIDKKAVQLKVAEQEIDKRLKQLQEHEQKLRKLIQEYNEKERAKINALIKVYSSMKPKDAARIFNTLDIDVTVALLKDMKPSTSSAILAQMNAEKAKEITDKIIGNNF